MPFVYTDKGVNCISSWRYKNNKINITVEKSMAITVVELPSFLQQRNSTRIRQPSTRYHCTASRWREASQKVSARKDIYYTPEV
jgi:hypothetical protein